MTDKSWKNFEKHDRKSLTTLSRLSGCEQLVTASEDSEGGQEHGRGNLYYTRGRLNHHQRTVDRNVDVKGFASEVSDGTKENVIGR